METSVCIKEGLYLGGILSALNESDLAHKGITHILSVDENPLPDAISKKVIYKHISALDVSDCDLLCHFPETYVFIDQARSGGGHVLVHCQAGVSRSATVVCAYLMQKMSTSKDKVLELIATSRPSVSPNSGFMEQLDLFEAMGCQVVKSHPLYRSFQLHKLADRFQSGSSAIGSPEMEALYDLLLDSDFSMKSNDAYYKCRKCRLILFRHGAVTSHMTGKGESAFGWHGPMKHSQVPLDEQIPCQRSLFVDPLVWMKGKINSTSGKLHCPKCDIKIGSFVWYGERCPCGTWVAPAFHIDGGKVDKIPFQTVVPSTRMLRGTADITNSSIETPVNLHTETQLPNRFLSRDHSQGAGFPPSTLATRSFGAKSNTAVIAAVAPLGSALSGDGGGVLVASRMETEDSSDTNVPSSSRTHIVNHVEPFSHQSTSAASGAHHSNSVQMDMDV